MSREHWIGGNHISGGIFFKQYRSKSRNRVVIIYKNDDMKHPEAGDILKSHEPAGKLATYRFTAIYEGVDYFKKTWLQRLKRLLHPMPPIEIDYSTILVGEVTLTELTYKTTTKSKL